MSINIIVTLHLIFIFGKQEPRNDRLLSAKMKPA